MSIKSKLYGGFGLLVLVAVALVIWGLVGFGLVPSLQLRVISLAGSGGDMAATLGASAVNLGIAAGAVLGGWTLSAYGIRDVPLTALIVCAVALPATWATRWLKVPSAPAASGIPAGTADTPVTASPPVTTS